MMDKSSPAAGGPTGEVRLKNRRNRLWRNLAIGMVVAALFGFSTGFASDAVKDGTLPGWAYLAFIGLAIVAFGWATWDYTRQIDELDLLDNLWSSFFGFYFYAAALGAWHFAHEAGLVGPVQHYAIFFASFSVILLTYGLRKLGLR